MWERWPGKARKLICSQLQNWLTAGPWFIICRIYISASRALCPQLTKIDGFCNNCSCMYLKSENIPTWVGRNLTRSAETQLCNCDSVVIVYFSTTTKNLAKYLRNQGELFWRLHIWVSYNPSTWNILNPNMYPNMDPVRWYALEVI